MQLRFRGIRPYAKYGHEALPSAAYLNTLDLGPHLGLEPYRQLHTESTVSYLPNYRQPHTALPSETYREQVFQHARSEAFKTRKPCNSS